jgi:DNA invertase Pin-like site-specific DNA recombinase
VSLDNFSAADFAKPVRVISYTRFSTRKQSKGTSYARQVEQAQEWCKENGYIWDEEDHYKDLGVSAYSGANAATGALADLQRHLANGQIAPGTVLIVEALDRITRAALTDAISLLMSLATAGLRIVTLSDGKVWDKKIMNDLGSFLMSVVTLYRGHQESEMKSQRLQKTFALRREEGSQRAFGSAPGWLSRESQLSPWEVDEEKATIVRKVFELAAAGMGSKAIAGRANAETWVVPTRLNRTKGRWHAQLPGQLLRNRAVLGEHQHRLRSYGARETHWRGTEIGVVKPDYYPRIIEDELWYRARAAIGTRSIAKRRDSHYFNVFAGMMFCGMCGAPVQRKLEHDGYSRAQLQCSDKLAGLTDCKTMAAMCADIPILHAIQGYMLTPTIAAPVDDKVALLEAAEAEIAELRKRQQRIGDLVSATEGEIGVYVEQARTLQEKLKQAQARREELLHEIHSVTSRDHDDYSALENAVAYLYLPADEQAKEQRAALHLRLARAIDCVFIWAYDAAVIRYRDGAQQAVRLSHKRLPSRSNPNAKYHRPPKPRKEPEQPYYIEAISAELAIPVPRRAVSTEKHLRDLLVERDDILREATEAPPEKPPQPHKPSPKLRGRTTRFVMYNSNEEVPAAHRLTDEEIARRDRFEEDE